MGIDGGCFKAGSVLGFHLNSGSQMTPDRFISVAWSSLMISTHCTNACELSAFRNALCVRVCVCERERERESERGRERKCACALRVCRSWFPHIAPMRANCRRFVIPCVCLCVCV